MKNKYQHLKPIDGSSLAVFRIAFGLLLSWYAFSEIINGQVVNNYLNTAFQFKYPGFGWVNPTSDQLLWSFKLLATGGLMLAFGVLYRLAAIINFFAFACIFLTERAEYQNHYYFMLVLNFVMIWLPASRTWSLDNVFFNQRPQLIPRWSKDLLCFLLGCTYFFGGIAKLNPDWLQGFPMVLWTERLHGQATIGWLMELPNIGLMMSWAGLWFDLTIVAFLLWRKTRIPAFVVAVLFHLLNSQMFSIGVFPWLGIAMTTLFFPPEWPRRLLHLPPRQAYGSTKPTPKPVVYLMASLVVCQIVLPLRYHLLPGDPNWTRFGHLYSWRMKLNDHQAHISFHVLDRSGQRNTMLPRAILTRRQVNKMSIRPELIRQFAHHLRQVEKERGRDVEVFAQAYISWNGRAYQRYIDPQVDLSREPHSVWSYDWVLPNQIPEPSQTQPPGLHPSIQADIAIR